MEDFFGLLIFFIIIVLSIAQNVMEKIKERKSRDQMSRSIQERKESHGSRDEHQVRQAKPKGSARQSPEIEPGTSGKELIEALFGEGADDDDEGWVPVKPEKPKPAPVRQRQGTAARTATPANPAAERQRAQEHAARQQQEQTRKQQTQRQRQTEKEKARPEQQSRQQVSAERQRRKQERQRQQQTPIAAQQHAPRRARIDAMENMFIPQDLGDVRRAIVMAEIVGPPIALQDRFEY